MTNFNNHIISSFHSVFNRNIECLIDRIVEKIRSTQNSFYAASFIYSLYQYPKQVFDLDIAIEALSEIKDNSNGIDFLSQYNYMDFNINQNIDYYEFLDYRKNTLEPIELKYRLDYFEGKKENEHVNKLLNYNLFLDSIVANEKLESLIRGRPAIINEKKWMDNCFKVIQHFYNDFVFRSDLSRKGVIKFEKKVNDTTSIILQYNERNFKASVTRTWVEIPELRMYVFFEDPASQKIEELYLGTPNFLFSSPITQPNVIFSKKTFIQKSQTEFAYNSIMKRIKIDSRTTMIKHVCDFENEIKLQLYYYFDLYSYWSKVLLGYVTECIHESSE